MTFDLANLFNLTLEAEATKAKKDKSLHQPEKRAS